MEAGPQQDPSHLQCMLGQSLPRLLMASRSDRTSDKYPHVGYRYASQRFDKSGSRQLGYSASVDCPQGSARVGDLERYHDRALHSHSTDMRELPLPGPRACFRRDELVGRIVGLAENLAPLPHRRWRIDKSSTVLTAPHHGRIKWRF